ncbi:transporter, partial [Pseudomonas syringae pv. tagetis]
DIDSCDLPDWLDDLDANLPHNAWLGGWSLGGMLAAALAARRGEGCSGLLTLASNACFVTRGAWPNAMAAQDFDAGLAGCPDAPGA